LILENIREEFDRVKREMADILFEDIFDVKDIDTDGKKFERGFYRNLAF
jgi:hypothetical protein